MCFISIQLFFSLKRDLFKKLVQKSHNFSEIHKNLSFHKILCFLCNTFSVSSLPKTDTISHQNFDLWLALKIHTIPPWNFNFSRHKIPQISTRKIRIFGKMICDLQCLLIDWTIFNYKKEEENNTQWFWREENEPNFLITWSLFWLSLSLEIDFENFLIDQLFFSLFLFLGKQFDPLHVLQTFYAQFGSIRSGFLATQFLLFFDLSRNR
jgi:hypothetical protein